MLYCVHYLLYIVILCLHFATMSRVTWCYIVLYHVIFYDTMVCSHREQFTPPVLLWLHYSVFDLVLADVRLVLSMFLWDGSSWTNLRSMLGLSGA